SQPNRVHFDTPICRILPSSKLSTRKVLGVPRLRIRFAMRLYRKKFQNMKIVAFNDAPIDANFLGRLGASASAATLCGRGNLDR
ncbi:hypothetical protein SB763_32820, partial [Burkholderia sp. SIMBA_042]|uniref:hypothetical protein n=1 Tax=Burkholderia sp. SIMBA_042 TaxID=3085783 RepID=UPI00397E076D